MSVTLIPPRVALTMGTVKDSDSSLIDRYFRSGGTLAGLVKEVQLIIQQATFTHAQQEPGEVGAQRRLIQRRLEEAVEYRRKKSGASQALGVIDWVWDSIYGRAKEEEYIPYAEKLVMTLVHWEIEPTVIPALFGPDTTLVQALFYLRRYVEERDLFQNVMYRDEFRTKLHLLVKKEWDYQTLTTVGNVKGVWDKVVRWGKKTPLEEGFDWLEKIDYWGAVKRNLEGTVEVLNLKGNRLYITKAWLEEYTQNITRVSFINLEGCLQLSDEDIFAVLKDSWGWIRCIFPDGRKVDSGKKPDRVIPPGFDGAADENLDLKDWVLV